jgi:hypothetical protein
MFGVIGFEFAIPSLVEMDNDRHDFTGRQLGGSQPFNRSILEQPALPLWLKLLAEIIDMAE